MEVERFLSQLGRREMFLCFTAVLLLAGAVSQYSSQPAETEKPKVALIVFDGGDWTVIKQLQEQDRVPHITRYMEEGAYGNFSTPRAFSPITWTKIGTGQSTEDVGIEGWNEVKDNGETRLIQSGDVKNYRIWNYLNMANVSTGVVNYFLTWPVEEVEGFLVSGTLARGPDRVYPEGYFENETLMREGSEWQKADAVLDKHKDEVSFLTLGFKRIDGIQHHLWKFVEPEPFGRERKEENDKYREIVYNEYENLDQVLSRFDDSWNVIVVSDSGFQPEGMEEPGAIAPTNAFVLSPLIQELGYAEYRETLNYGQEIMRPIDAQSSLREGYFTYPKTPEINSTTYRFKFVILNESMDIQKTMEDLEKVDYVDGRDFFYNAHYKNTSRTGQGVILGRYKIYRDGFSDTRVVSDYIDHPTIPTPLMHVENAIELKMPDGGTFKLWSEAEQSGDHPPGATDGIFIARGPAIKDQGRIPKDMIGSTDIAPTILYMYNISIPRSMDGEVVKELFTEDFNSERTVRYSNVSTLKSESRLGNASSLEEQAIKNRLRELGYAP